MVMQLRMWHAITTKEKLSIKAHFLTPWSNTHKAQVTSFLRQLDRSQVKCEDHGVTVTDDNKLDHFMGQMYACGLFEAKFLDNCEETVNKSWRATQPHFARQFNKEQFKLER